MKKHIPVIVALFMMFIFGYICPTWSTVTRLGLEKVREMLLSDQLLERKEEILAQ